MAKIKAKKVASVKSLKASLKKGGGGAYLQRVKEEGMTVRFLTEPEEWFEYWEYFDPNENNFLPEAEGVVLPIDERTGEKVKSSKRFLANVVDTQDNKVIPLVLPKSLAESLMRFYDKYSTIMDRDYELTREGSGFDTRYAALPEGPEKFKFDKFDPIDLMAALQAQVDDDDDADDDDDDDDLSDVDVPGSSVEALRRSASRRAPGTKTPAKTVSKKSVESKAKKPMGKKKKSKK